MFIEPQIERRGARAALLLLGFMALAALDLRAAFELAPAAILAFLLYLGYRPGERLIARIHEYRRRRKLSGGSREPAPSPTLGRTISLIGRIAASGLAMRPPPLLRLT